MLTDKSIRDFINELKSSAPTPGGGGVAALVAANGVALIMMVANKTICNDKYAEWKLVNESVLKEAEDLLNNLVEGVDTDAEVFSKLMDSYKTKDDKVIGTASVAAAFAPLSVMNACVRALELCSALLGKSNPAVESDLYVAAQCLNAGLESAKYNVDANIDGIMKMDEHLAGEMTTGSEELLAQGRALAAGIIVQK